MVCSQMYSPELWFESTKLPDGSEIHLVTSFAMDERADKMARVPAATAISLVLSQVRACVRVSVCVCACACMRECVSVRACVSVYA